MSDAIKSGESGASTAKEVGEERSQDERRQPSPELGCPVDEGVSGESEVVQKKVETTLETPVVAGSGPAVARAEPGSFELLVESLRLR